MNAHIFWPPLAVLAMCVAMIIFIILKYGDRLFKARTVPRDSYGVTAPNHNTGFEEALTVADDNTEYYYEEDEEEELADFVEEGEGEKTEHLQHQRGFDEILPINFPVSDLEKKREMEKFEYAV